LERRSRGLTTLLCPEDKRSVYEALDWCSHFLYIYREKNILFKRERKKNERDRERDDRLNTVNWRVIRKMCFIYYFNQEP
jgi:hypothetical protein